LGWSSWTSLRSGVWLFTPAVGGKGLVELGCRVGRGG
jgi:hypothetical protein